MSRFASQHNSEPDFSDSSHWTELKTCPLCGHSILSHILDARDRHYGNPGVFEIVECANCRLNFLNPMPTAAYLSSAYPENYYAYTLTIPKTFKERAVKTIKRVASALLFYSGSATGDPTFKTPETMLDIGCGAGAFLAKMREKGWKVYGVEFDPRAAERGRQEGLDIFAGTIEAAGYPDATFDYVRSNHSFEHINNPREVLREIRRVIKLNGLLFIGVPNVSGLMARWFGTYWWYLGAPVHTFGYSPATLRRLLAEEGFIVEQVNYNSSFWGIFGSLQIYANRKDGKNSEDGWIVHNPALMLLGHWFARITDLLSRGDCMEIIARPVSREAPSSGTYIRR
jgi:SAM-dependent methyltransferase